MLPIAALAAFMLPQAALAAPVSNPNGKAKAEILIPLAVLEIDDLDFGTLVTSPTSGTVTIPSGGGARIVAGGVSGLPSDPGNRAHFLVAADPGRQIIVTHSWPAFLVNGAGDQILLLSVNLDGLPVKTVDPVSGQAPLYFGGTIFVAADQAEGLYEANFTVTVDYR